MKMTDERINELAKKLPKFWRDYDDGRKALIAFARAIEAELEKQAPRWPIHEATHTMCLAGFDAIKNVPRGCTRRAHMRAVWAAMYAAMPEPPAAQNKEGNHET